MPLSTRFYLADAVFVAALSGPDPVLEGIQDALRRPRYPLFLGRRSCTPTGAIVLGLRDGNVEEALRAEDWHAAEWFRKKQRTPTVALEIFRDAAPGEPGETVRDVPLSFDPRHRDYAWRTVTRPEPLLMPTGIVSGDSHDPLSWW